MKAVRTFPWAYAVLVVAAGAWSVLDGVGVMNFMSLRWWIAVVAMAVSMTKLTGALGISERRQHVVNCTTAVAWGMILQRIGAHH